MNKRLIIILLFFFALLTPLVFNSPSKIYEVFAVDPTPFGPGPIVPPAGGGGTAGSGVADQSCDPDIVQGISGGTFDCIPLPTPMPTSSPIPASTPVAGQAITGWGSGLSPSRGSFQGVLPTATPIAGKAHSAWNGTSFDTIDVQSPIPTSTPTAGKAFSAWNGSTFDIMDVQVPLPTPTPTTNYVVRGWDGSAWIVSQLDYSELANAPTLGTSAAQDIEYFLQATQLGAASGVAPLDSNSLVPVANLPSIPDTSLASNGTLWKNAGTNTAAASSTHDFTSAEWLKLPVVNGVYGSCANGIFYFDSADSTCPIHYCNGATDTAICGVTVSGNTTTALSTTGSLTEGDTLKIDANGNAVDSGTPFDVQIIDFGQANAAGVVCNSGGTGVAIQYFGINSPVLTTPDPYSVGGPVMMSTAHYAGTAYSLACGSGSSPPTSETYTFTLMNRGAATGLTCQTTHNVYSCTDTAHTASIGTNGAMYIKLVCSGGTTAGDIGGTANCTVKIH